MTNYRFIGKSAIVDGKILVIADLHLGYEENLRQKGVFLPKQQYKETIKELEKIFKEIDKKKSVNKKTIDNNKGGLINKGSINNKEKVKEIIILGDLKHEFAGILQQEWREVLDLFDYLKRKMGKGGKIIIIKGNHDNYLANIAEKKGVEIKDFYIINNIAFIHGNKIFPEILDLKIKQIFLGHLHPAVSIRKNVKEEKYKCFLVGKFKDKEIIILPSFFPLVEGQDVNRSEIEDTNLAFKPNLSGFEVFIPAEDKVYDFGKLKDVGRLV